MSDEVRLFEKKFEKFISEKEIAARVKQIALKITSDFKDKNPVFLPVLNGAFYFASDLFKHIDFDYEVSFVKMSSYSGMQSGEKLYRLIGFDENLANRSIIIIEDIIDTGRTMYELGNQLKEIAVSDIKIASLIFKPGALKFNISPDYVGFESGNDFLIGYGLDFDKKGRHYKDIYKLKEE